MTRLLFPCALVLLFTCGLQSQNEATVFGLVRDIDTKVPIEFATVYIKGSAVSAESNNYGEYTLPVPPGAPQVLVFSRLGYRETEVEVRAIPSGKKRNINIFMVPEASDVEVIIRASRIEDVGMVTEEVTELKKLPTASGNFESILPHIALGTSAGSGGELSAQYNVRGGNYDENLIYVNDFEIFRPQLIRTGQQEGLTFPNIDLIRDISFSSGGFESRYGDKMSSVLDIHYKRPETFQSSVAVNFLGASAHVEGSKRIGANSYNKLRYLVGARYKTTRYLLGSLDVDGEYAPDFTDFQTFLTYDITRNLQLGFLGNYNRSKYNFVPRSRTTATGLIDFSLQLTSLFEGREADVFTNGMGGVSLTYIPERERNPIFLKWMASGYGSEESETFDILGYYSLSQIETSLEGEGAVQEVAVLGTGTQHIFARNKLYSTIFNTELRGGIELQSSQNDNNHFLQWGVKYQSEEIDDRLNEWERLDSAGYSLPYNEEEVLLYNVIKSENTLTSSRVQAYFQDAWSVTAPNRYELRLTGGVRANYWSLNSQLAISPRFQMFYRPLKINPDITFKLSGGLYYQPPFYRELRRPDGSVNTDLEAQRSLHVVAGLSYDFPWEKISRKKFRLIGEVYYKKLNNLVSYEIDNVRIRYSGENDASGHVVGLDMRINGEFVPGAESWLNVSVLQARESLDGITHMKREVGASEAFDVSSVPRPSDRTVNVSLFFQDYLPKNKDFKMQLNLNFGSGLPFGLKDNNTVFRNTYRFKSYQRVDIGFSYVLWDESKRASKPFHAFRFARQASISFEVFNLLDVANVAANTWIKTIGNAQYAIPNFLTSRRINLRFKIDI